MAKIKNDKEYGEHLKELSSGEFLDISEYYPGAILGNKNFKEQFIRISQKLRDSVIVRKPEGKQVDHKGIFKIISR